MREGGQLSAKAGRVPQGRCADSQSHVIRVSRAPTFASPVRHNSSPHAVTARRDLAPAAVRANMFEPRLSTRFHEQGIHGHQNLSVNRSRRRPSGQIDP